MVFAPNSAVFLFPLNTWQWGLSKYYLEPICIKIGIDIFRKKKVRNREQIFPTTLQQRCNENAMISRYSLEWQWKELVLLPIQPAHYF